jgi:uncharacterized membrane protein
VYIGIIGVVVTFVLTTITVLATDVVGPMMRAGRDAWYRHNSSTGRHLVRPVWDGVADVVLCCLVGLVIGVAIAALSVLLPWFVIKTFATPQARHSPSSGSPVDD